MSYTCPPVIYEYRVINSRPHKDPKDVSSELTKLIMKLASDGWEPISIGGGGLTTSKAGDTTTVQHAGYVLIRRPAKLNKQ
ncbi:MAG: hypothetical protein K5798_02005 [Nitrosopumilus sp.]|uniref:hypothetical protein n=1 Tax=Nitrosopumilus sp. TaxID=2024843 RepID=UPI00242B8E54|nr:hypothetical protein [Nitrosopumilus sp.]MCV0366023.1 hypothetical protein [Nitrosopumilus sp.]